MQNNQQVIPQAQNAQPAPIPTATLVANAAQMVARYSKNLIKDERAQEFMARVSLIVRQEPKLGEAIRQNPDSFVTAMMACVQLDLMPNTPQEFAYILPYNDRRFGLMAKFQIGYRGLRELAYRSGTVKSLSGEIVFEGDTFDVEFGTDRKLVHKPNFNVDRTDFSKATHAYIVATMSNDEKLFFVMTRAEIEKIREDTKARNGGKDTPAWVKWWDQQALKTVLKRATKMLPSSTKDNRLAFAAQIDSLAEAGKLTLDVDGVEEGRMVVRPQLNDQDTASVKAEASDLAKSLLAESEAQNGN